MQYNMNDAEILSNGYILSHEYITQRPTSLYYSVCYEMKIIIIKNEEETYIRPVKVRRRVGIMIDRQQ